MGKVSMPNNDHRFQEEYSQSNSKHVESNESDSLATLNPPEIVFNQNKKENQEEEETQELQSETVTFDTPAEDDSNSGEDNTGGSEDDPYSSSETNNQFINIDPHDNKHHSESNEGSNINKQEAYSESVTSFKKNSTENKAPFSLPPTVQLKQNLEQQYGFSLADTKVIQNSSEPAQFKAHAFARGNEVHLGPGQEKHLGHELAHVVQQKQGKVKSTTVENGSPVNDDPHLEREADMMASDAMQLKTGSQNVAKSPLQKMASSSQVFQFSKPDKAAEKKAEKVEKKVSISIPDKKILERDFKYAEATLNVASGLELAFLVDKKGPDLFDEVAVNKKGLALKKEGPNLVSKEIEQKLSLEVKNGVELSSVGGKVGLDCKLGGESIYSGTGVEFSFINVDWTESDPLDKIKILTTTFKSPEVTKKISGTIGGELHTLTAKIQLQCEVEASKRELLKQIVMRFGHLFTAECAIAGSMVVAGAATIAAALHTIHMGKEIEERVENLIESILSYGRGFKGGFTGKYIGGSIDGVFKGTSARVAAHQKMPGAVFDAKIKSEGVGSTFSDAMYQAVQNLRAQAIEQFKKDHDVDDDSFFDHDLKKFKQRLKYLCESKYLRDRLSEI